MAVQTICYEIRMAWLSEEINGSSEQYPTAQQMHGFYEHLEQTLYQTDFIIKAHPGQIMNKLRRLFNRARPEEIELNILRGILTATQRSIVNKSNKD